jgi:uncharacterized protein involved in type VI secretion and phage assembly
LDEEWLRSEQIMQVRGYKESDLKELQRIHAEQGSSYEFPDLGNPLFLTKWVLVGDEPGREEASGEEAIDKQSRREGTCAAADAPKEKIVAAALQRLTAEAYLLLDPKAGTPRER